MIQCKKCGAENEDGALFCASCGARTDGKKACPACGKFIKEENLYCNYCGARVDGKTVCTECGAVYEGAFCPQCGSGAPKQKAAAAATVGEYKGYKNVLDIVKLSLIFTAIVIMLIFSFFVGVKLKAKDGSFSVPTSFTYLITQFKNISEIIEKNEFNGTKIYGNSMRAHIFPRF